MPLDAVAARAAVEPVARRLGFSVERTALGILDIVAATMVRAIRVVSIERGHDPRECALMAYGGAGALHASMVARELGMRRVLIPAAPGILCAQGLVVADLAEELVRSRRVTLDETGVPVLRGLVDSLWPQAQAWFTTEDVALSRRQAELVLDMRYVGQNFELRVAVSRGDGKPAIPEAGAIRSLFDRAHEQVYGYANLDDAVECVSLRLVLRGTAAPRFHGPREALAQGTPAAAARRTVHFHDTGGVDTPVYQRAELQAGHVVPGPAIIEQLDATTVVMPGDQARVRAGGALHMDVGKA
jgi:N-methylhydantoinase A